MKMKLFITNFHSFEKAINECAEPVFLLDAKGEKRKITNYTLEEMRQQYKNQKDTLLIKCMCSLTSDYYRLLSAAVWE